MIIARSAAAPPGAAGEPRRRRRRPRLNQARVQREDPDATLPRRDFAEGPQAWVDAGIRISQGRHCEAKEENGRVALSLSISRRIFR
jgi:hypothetical protein